MAKIIKIALVLYSTILTGYGIAWSAIYAVRNHKGYFVPIAIGIICGIWFRILVYLFNKQENK